MVSHIQSFKSNFMLQEMSAGYIYANTNSNNDKINELNNKYNTVHIALIGFW